MAFDRLAAMRRNQGSEYGSPPPPTHYELGRLSNIHAGGEESGMVNINDAFFQEITGVQDDIRKLEQHINTLVRIHAQQIDAVELHGNNLSREAESVTGEARDLNNSIKSRIHLLRSLPADNRTRSIRNPQIELVRTRFMAVLERFQNVEKEYRERSRDRIVRQVKIVKPDASPEQIDEVVRGGETVQVFAQAVTSQRFAQGQSAYNAVKERHDEVMRIEKQLVELSQLFNDMAILVEEQNDAIDHTLDSTEKTRVDIEKGKVALDKGVLHAISYRKGRWICFVISIIIIIALAVGITCGVSSKC